MALAARLVRAGPGSFLMPFPCVLAAPRGAVRLHTPLCSWLALSPPPWGLVRKRNLPSVRSSAVRNCEGVLQTLRTVAGTFSASLYRDGKFPQGPRPNCGHPRRS